MKKLGNATGRTHEGCGAVSVNTWLVVFVWVELDLVPFVDSVEVVLSVDGWVVWVGFAWVEPVEVVPPSVDSVEVVPSVDGWVVWVGFVWVEPVEVIDPVDVLPEVPDVSIQLPIVVSHVVPILTQSTILLLFVQNPFEQKALQFVAFLQNVSLLHSIQVCRVKLQYVPFGHLDPDTGIGIQYCPLHCREQEQSESFRHGAVSLKVTILLFI